MSGVSNSSGCTGGDPEVVPMVTLWGLQWTALVGTHTALRVQLLKSEERVKIIND